MECNEAWEKKSVAVVKSKRKKAERRQRRRKKAVIKDCSKIYSIQKTVMIFLQAQSCECLKSELLLLDIPPTQTAIDGTHLVEYKQISSLTDDSPIKR